MMLMMVIDDDGDHDSCHCYYLAIVDNGDYGGVIVNPNHHGTLINDFNYWLMK